MAKFRKHPPHLNQGMSRPSEYLEDHKEQNTDNNLLYHLCGADNISFFKMLHW